MKFSHFTMIAMLGAAIAAPSFGQPGPGPGMGSMAPGQGKGMRFTFDKDNTAGWALMTAEERTAHRDKMLAAKSLDACKALQDEHHKAMEARAKEKGVALRTPRQNVCDRMKDRGFFK